MNDQLLSCMNTWYRSADYDEDHRKLFTKTLKEMHGLQETTSKVEKLLQDYISNKE